MTTLFIICAVAGTVVLLVGVLSDGVLDFDGGIGVSSFGVFVGCFGAIGLITKTFNNSPYIYLTLSLVVALVIAAIFITVMRLLRKQGEGAVNETPDMSSLIGTEVTVVHWKDTRGEVIASYAGSPRRLAARSDVPLINPASVFVTKVFADQSVEVASHTTKN